MRHSPTIDVLKITSHVIRDCTPLRASITFPETALAPDSSRGEGCCRADQAFGAGSAARRRDEVAPRSRVIQRPTIRISTCEQYIKEGKCAVKWTRLSCRSFAANAVRLQLHALAYNLGNFMRMLAMPRMAEPWSLTSLKEKLIKIGAKVVSHGRYVTFQMAEVAVSRQMFTEILSLIARLRAPPAPA